MYSKDIKFETLPANPQGPTNYNLRFNVDKLPCLRTAPIASSNSKLIMSTVTDNSTKKHQFMVYAPDMKDDSAFQRRLDARGKHLEGIKNLLESGHVGIKTGGPLLSPESIVTKGAANKMVGTMMVIEASSIEEVEKVVENDVYYTSGVWNPEAIVILPFLAVTQ